LYRIREKVDEVGEHTLKRALGPTNLIALKAIGEEVFA